MTARTVVAGWSGLAPHFLSALGVMVAAVLGVAGTMKVFAFPAGVPPHGGTVPLASQIAVGAVGGIPAVLCCFVLLYLSAAGAGPWSVDARRDG